MKISKSIKLRYSIVLTMAVLGFIVRAIAFPEINQQNNFLLLGISIILIAAIWEVFRLINTVLGKNFPIEEKPISRIVLQLALGALAVFAIRALGFAWIGPYFPTKFSWEFRAAVYAVDFFFSAAINVMFFAQDYFKRWKATIERAEKLEKEKTQVQFDNLKNQLNPHFLFNALTSLNSLIFSDQQLASDFLQHLSRVYRYVLQHKDKEQVSLSTEVEFIANFIFLLETRFGRAFKAKLNLSEEALERGVVPVTLQIMLENAIKHNVMNEMRPLEVEITDHGDYLLVKNNLQRKKVVESSNKQGLDNLKNLYRYLSPLNVLVEETPHEYCVKIPLLK
ncbi:MAG: histidine kinase [Bacteroidetes bacterium]|nr:MAG: histidine kinase [Bacteroidota bacterium]